MKYVFVAALALLAFSPAQAKIGPDLRCSSVGTAGLPDGSFIVTMDEIANSGFNQVNIVATGANSIGLSAKVINRPVVTKMSTGTSYFYEGKSFSITYFKSVNPRENPTAHVKTSAPEFQDLEYDLVCSKI